MSDEIDVHGGDATFDVYRWTSPGRHSGERLGTFMDREEAFAFARAFAAQNRCDMIVSCPAPEAIDNGYF